MKMYRTKFYRRRASKRIVVMSRTMAKCQRPLCVASRRRGKAFCFKHQCPWPGCRNSKRARFSICRMHVKTLAYYLARAGGCIPHHFTTKPQLCGCRCHDDPTGALTCDYESDSNSDSNSD